MAYTKIVNGLQFQLRDYNITEKYAIWDNEQKRYIRTRDNATLTGTSGKTYPFDETKYIPKEEFKIEFPHKQKVNKIARTILLNGEPTIIELPKTCNDRLNETIQLLQTTQTNPLGVTYQIHKTGEGLQTRYSISIVPQGQTSSYNTPHTTQPTNGVLANTTGTGQTQQKTEVVSPPVTQPSQPVPVPTPQPTTPQSPAQAIVNPTPPLQLTPLEQDLINKIKNMGIQPTPEQFQEICKLNQLTDTIRNNIIYEMIKQTR